ncbi:MAG: hypothetical protein AAGD96_13065, partial [Chloroflexota bacterium]
ITGCMSQTILTEDSAQSSAENLLIYHEGYWVTRVGDGLIKPELINDTHVSAETNRITVYAQIRLFDNIIEPAQVGPDECTTMRNGDPHCFHPNAVYLNGSGQELNESDGTGAWWVKHAWTVDGEGYMNCEPIPQEVYDDCFWVDGTFMEDGLGVRVGQLNLEAGGWYNVRTPVLNDNPITFQITRFEPANSDSAAGVIDLTPTQTSVITLKCRNEASAFDNQIQACR